VTDRLFAATKISTRAGRDAGIAQMRASLSILGSPIELMQVHNLQDVPAHIASIRAWKDEGRIRYAGVTTSSTRAHAELIRWMQSEPIDFVQVNCSIDDRAAEERVLPLAAERGIAVLCNLPFGRGRLFRSVVGHPLPAWTAEFDCRSWAQFFLKYLVSHPAVTAVIPATTNPDHLSDNMGAGTGALPDEATRRRMVRHFESL
jgi:diketogulonate reductase-like aldo/keto reductase